ncbi:hypothetical protein [Absidia glauca]|uniref:Uncharacterized protein n=1 Tax=Absidia glauca TaxID=4829 RepID=A0A168SX17_ABSGL|nr:hypothetical protein [Absidia glauca]
MNGAYLYSLPREMMRSIAGFPIKDRSFYLARAALDLPTSLCKRLFPTIDEWRERLAAKEISPGDPIKPTDSALMMEPHPCHPIWQHPIFSDPAYLSFKRDLLQIEAQEHDPAPHTPPTMCAYAL